MVFFVSSAAVLRKKCILLKKKTSSAHDRELNSAVVTLVFHPFLMSANKGTYLTLKRDTLNWITTKAS
jgi:hypothetical protein